MNLMKKLAALIIAVVLTAVLIPTTSVFADSVNPYIVSLEIPNNVCLADIGTEITLTAIGYDQNHQVIPEGGDYTYEWYYVAEGVETFVGSGTTYTIASAEEKDLYSEANNACYKARICYKGASCNSTDAYLYNVNTVDATGLFYDYGRIGEKGKLRASLNYNLSFEDNGISVKWYKESGSSWIYVGSGETYPIDSLTASDFGTYKYDIYWNGTKIASSLKEYGAGLFYRQITLEEDTPSPVTTAYVAGSPYIEDGVITGTLPDGITYDSETNTFTLNGYEGTLNCSLLDIKYGDANVKIVGDNTVNFVEGFQVSAIASNPGQHLTIFGSGTLNIHYSGDAEWSSAIRCATVTEIKDCTLNITAENIDHFYAISSADTWNYDNGALYSAVNINNATINIDSINTPDAFYDNAGIFLEDEDLSIINSNININLEYGRPFGICAGYYVDGYHCNYGGEIYIDPASTIIIHTKPYNSTRSYTFLFYKLNFDDLHIYSGESEAYGSTKSENDYNNKGYYQGQYSNNDNYFEISAHTWTSKIVKATTSKDGSITRTCNHCGEKDSEIIPSIKSISLDKSSGTYIGDCQYGWIVYPTVLDRKGNEISFKDSVTDNFESVGTHSVKVTSDSELYKFSKTLSYTIVPKGTTISKLSASSKGFTVTWKAQKTQTTGYQIRYATKSSMSKATTVTLKKNTTVSKKITKLKGKTKYYVQVRTYKTVGGKKYCSSWSKKKTVTTKK